MLVLVLLSKKEPFSFKMVDVQDIIEDKEIQSLVSKKEKDSFVRICVIYHVIKLMFSEKVLKEAENRHFVSPCT